MTRTTGTILLVEDEAGLIRTLDDRLRAEGYHVLIASNGTEAVRVGLEGTADLILLDVMLPEPNGFEVLAELRCRGITAPVIMLTARDPVEDKVAAFKLGADDYLTKPFRVIELLARIEALLRRVRQAALAPEERVVRFGPWTVDLWEGQVEGPDGRVPLSPTEFELLAHLVRRRGHPVSRQELLREVWRYAPSSATRTVDQHVAQLRRKLEIRPGAGRLIVTVHGQGYLLRAG
jgi:DNA-binding response OmpR family regulator